MRHWDALCRFTAIVVHGVRQSRASMAAEIHVQHQAELVVHLVGTVAGVVLVLVIGIELEVFSKREVSTEVNRRVAPFAVLAVVEELSTGVGRRMVATDPDAFFQLDAVAVAPGEVAGPPVQVGAVTV